MKQTVLGVDKNSVQAVIHRRVIICTILCLCALFANVLITLLHTPDNHTLLIMINVLVDTVVGWISLWMIDTSIIPQKRLLSLLKRPGTEVSGTVKTLSRDTERYLHFDCLAVTISDHKVFLVDNESIHLEVGQTIKAKVVDGIITEVSL